MKYIDLFGGIGGFRYGIREATSNNESQSKERRPREGRDGTIDEQGTRLHSGQHTSLCYREWECVFYNDFDKFAVQTYNKNYGENYEATDITTFKTTDIPDHDCICGGFPCQTFSIAGKRKGFEDIRGTMFFEIMRIAKAKRTKYLFLENVKGLLNHNKGKTFTSILQTLEELGYETQWMVLNSKFFGVPQNRERVFIIASLRGTSRPEVLPFKKSSTEINQTQQQISSTITAGYYKGGGRDQQYVQYDPNQKGNRSQEHRVYKPETLAPTLTKSQADVKIMDLYNKKEHSDRCPTLTEPHHNTLRVRDGTQIRRLTPVECERLQGFPDNWTEGVSDTQRYKQMGNAVTTNVIEAIVRSWESNKK